MQEGTPAFVGMVKISAACARLKAAGLPYLVYLRHPTTGGVFASWGSLGQVTVAEPGAMIGFLGARVYEALYGQPFPEGVQTAENLFEHGLIDAILPVEALAEIADRALNVLTGPRRGPARRARAAARSRSPTSPPGTRSCARGATTGPACGRCSSSARRTCCPLHGTGQGEYDPGLLMALARFGGAPCIVLGQDRRGQTLDAPLSPKGLRVARRGMALALELEPAAREHRRHGRCRAVEGGRGGRHGRRDRPVPRRARHARRADRLRAARPGHRRRCARR